MSDVFNTAYQMAMQYHARQLYGDKPYSYHLDSVVDSVKRKWGEGNRALLAAAVLHDILEDTECSEEQLKEAVGKDITKCVVALTKKDGEQYEAYIYRVKEYHYSKEVKIHDTLCNLTESIMADSAYRVRKYSNQLQLLLK